MFGFRFHLYIIKIYYLLMMFWLSKLLRYFINLWDSQIYIEIIFWINFTWAKENPWQIAFKLWRKLTRVELDMEVLYNLQQHRLSLYKLYSNNKLIKYTAHRAGLWLVLNNFPSKMDRVFYYLSHYFFPYLFCYSLPWTRSK